MVISTRLRRKTSLACPAGSASRITGSACNPPSRPSIAGSFVCRATSHCTATLITCVPRVASMKLMMKF